jgi:hypothetical protein
VFLEVFMSFTGGRGSDAGYISASTIEKQHNDERTMKTKNGNAQSAHNQIKQVSQPILSRQSLRYIAHSLQELSQTVDFLVHCS